MYNEELKKRYIREHTTSLEVARNLEYLFEKTSKFEQIWGADICEVDEQTLKPAIKDIAGLRKTSNLMTLAMLKEYAKWRIDNNIENSTDALLNISDVGIDKFRELTVPNPGYLQRFLNDILDPERLKTTDNLYRFYYWMAFSGFDERDIFEIKGSDVDFGNMSIKYEKKDTLIPIYREAMECVRNCAELDSFLYINSNYKNPIVRKRVEGDLLMRGIRSMPTPESVRVDVSRRCRKFYNKTNIKLSFSRVRLSGIFYRAYYDEMSGVKPNFLHAVLDDIRGKEYALESRRTTEESIIRKKIKSYNEDYERWKLAWTYNK